MIRTGMVLALALAGSGCKNSCQAMCSRMAGYAEECGFSVADAEVSSCVEDQSAAEAEARAACREFGAPSVIRSEWTCDELQNYFGADAEG